jgi:predicted DNA-binding transcriptional regulator YafY
MTDVPKKLVVNLETGIQSYIDLTPEEIEQRELDAIAFATAQAEREAAEEAAQAAKESANSKLTALGLTAEEIAALTK